MMKVNRGRAIFLLLVALAGCGRPLTDRRPEGARPTLPHPRILTRANPAPAGVSGGTLRFAVFAEPKSFNPVMANETSSTDVTNRLYVALLSLNYRTMKLEGDLAESWEESPDHLSLTFTLREGLKWSDGTPLTADDVIFTFQVVHDRKIASSRRDGALINGKSAVVEKLDLRRVRFRLPEPYAAAAHSLGSGIPIIPRHKLESAYRAGTFPSTLSLKTPPRDVAVNGPFTLREYRAGERVVLERNPYYFGVDTTGRPLPYLDRIVFLIVPDFNVMLLKFLSGESDLFPQYVPRFHADLERGKEVGNYRLLDLGMIPASNFLFFNMNPAKLDPVKRKWFTSKKFRQACAHAIDRESMIRLVYMGKGGECSEFHPDSPWYNPNVKRYPYNLKRARELLLEAGFQYRGEALYDADGNRVSFSLLTNAGNNDRIATANIVKEDLVRLGMDVTFRAIDFNTLISKLNSTFDWEGCVLALTNYSSSIEPVFAKNVWMSSGFTHMWYPQQKSPATPWEAELDRLTAVGAREADPQKRKAIYDRVQEIFAEEIPLIYTVSRSALYAVSNRIGNAEVTPMSGILMSSDDTDLLSMLYRRVVSEHSTVAPLTVGAPRSPSIVPGRG